MPGIARCPTCGHDIGISEDTRFRITCTNCGTSMCPTCRTVLPSGVKYCPSCGFGVGPALPGRAEQPPSAPSYPKVKDIAPTPASPAAGEKHFPKWQTTGGYIIGREETPSWQPPPSPSVPKQDAYGALGIPVPSVSEYTPDYGAPIPPIPSAYEGTRPPFTAGPRMPSGPIPARQFPTGALVLLLIIVGFSLLGFIAWNQGWLERPLNAVQNFVSSIELPRWLPFGARDTTPPVISNVRVSDITDTSAVVSWETDEPTASQVMLCDPEGGCTWTELGETLVSNHSVNLTGLRPNTVYKFTATSTDARKNQAIYEGEFETLPASPTTPLIISNVTYSGLTDTSVRISWETDKPATSQVEYGTTVSYGSATPLSTQLTTNHSMTITGLKPSTTYHFRVKSKDAAGVETTSPDKTFTTRSAVSIAIEEGPEVGKRAPDFTIPDLSGKTVKLSDFRGNIVILKFWVDGQSARNEMPVIQAFYEKWSGKELVLLTVNWKQSPEEVQKFVKEKGLTFPVLLDEKGEVAAKYRVSPSIFPTTFFINSAGVIVEKRDPPMKNEMQIESILKSM